MRDDAERREQSQDVVEHEHLCGLHFGDPHPLCWQCEEDGRPESPDP
jgi:hypothetical protein